MTKIRMLLPQTIEIDVERSLGAISFHADPLRGDEVEVAERYQILTTAIAQQKTVATDYFTASRGTTTHRKIDPYHLRFADGAWYCIGYCHGLQLVYPRLRISGSVARPRRLRSRLRAGDD